MASETYYIAAKNIHISFLDRVYYKRGFTELRIKRRILKNPFLSVTNCMSTTNIYLMIIIQTILPPKMRHFKQISSHLL